VIRAPDKNWPAEKYLALVRRLQALWPDCRVAILGEPGGTHFADGVPNGCLDLINVPPERRMDIQVAALKRSAMAIGGMSGAMFVAMAAGCPTLFWGYPSSHARFHRENILRTPMIYHTELSPSVDAVVELARAFRSALEGSSARPSWSVAQGRAEAPLV
jgi:ADP-heptose:LPS heptosyltransferase